MSHCTHVSRTLIYVCVLILELQKIYKHYFKYQASHALCTRISTSTCTNRKYSNDMHKHQNKSNCAIWTTCTLGKMPVQVMDVTVPKNSIVIQCTYRTNTDWDAISSDRIIHVFGAVNNQCWRLCESGREQSTYVVYNLPHMHTPLHIMQTYR